MRFTAAFAALAASMAGMAQAQIARTSGMTADSFCSEPGNFCVTGVYVPESRAVNYTVVVNSGTAYGWTGIGVGEQMAGSNIVISWVNPDNSVTISQRSTVGNLQPTEARVSAAAFTRNTQSRVTPDYTIYSWLFPQDQAPTGSVNHIYAYAGASRIPASSASDATVRMHDSRGFFTLDLSKPYDGAAPAGLPGGTASATTNTSGSSMGTRLRDLNNKTTRLYLVHMIFMTVGWLFFAPLGALIARYGRTKFAWFPTHAAIQLFTITLVIIGFALGVSGVKSAGVPMWSKTHHKVGLALLILILIQGIAGIATHEVRKRTGNRFIGFFHIINGITMFGLAVWNCTSGLDLWTWQPPNYAKYIIWAWAGVVFLLYAAGMALIPRERRQAKAAGSSDGLVTEQKSA